MPLSFDIPEEALRVGKFEAFKIEGKPVNVKILGANAAAEWVKDHAVQVDLVDADIVTRQRLGTDVDPASEEYLAARNAIQPRDVMYARLEMIKQALKAYAPETFTESVLAQASVLQLDYTFRLLMMACDPLSVSGSLNVTEREKVNNAVSGPLAKVLGQMKR
jgi:hypothetical protein